MNRPHRLDEGPEERERETFEQLGYARCDAEHAERLCAELRAKREQLQQQIGAVQAENRTLERELLAQLASWRKLDDAQQRVDEVMPQLQAITRSLTYRSVAALLRGVNRVRALILRKHRRSN
jgi:septal ring factor EnvC (AmiA/AmiB activator)